MAALPVSERVWQTYPMSARDWERLAHYVRQRRDELGLTQEDVAQNGGPSTATLRLIENGTQQQSYRIKSLRQLEDALRWQPGSVQAVLSGGEPSPRGGPLNAPVQPRYVDPALQYLWETPGLSDEVKRGLIALVIGMRQSGGEEDRSALSRA